MKASATSTSGLLATIASLAALLLALATAVSPSAAASTMGGDAATQSPSNKLVSYGGISFTYDASLASSVVGQTVPEQKVGPNVPDWTTGPEYAKFGFNDFIGPGWDPAIFVFPVKTKYVDLDPNDPHATDIWLNRVNYLRDVLTRKVALPKSSWGPGSIVEFAPFLPPINAAVIYIGQQRFMNFKSGEGVRYLAQITQQPSPIGSDSYDTLYSFQGLTADGKYYVAARFPAFLASGPPPTPVLTTSTDPNWVDNYNQSLIRRIDRAKGSEFFPNLDILDEIMASLRVQSPGSPGMPQTGMPENQGDISAAWSPGVSLALAVALALIAVGLVLLGRRSKMN